MTKALDFLKQNATGEPGHWKEVVQKEVLDFPWKRYSYAIAIRVRREMKNQGKTQAQLAEMLGCTQQYVSLLLKGGENLTLETMSKLEQAMKMDLLGQLATFGD